MNFLNIALLAISIAILVILLIKTSKSHTIVELLDFDENQSPQESDIKVRAEFIKSALETSKRNNAWVSIFLRFYIVLMVLMTIYVLVLVIFLDSNTPDLIASGSAWTVLTFGTKLASDYHKQVSESVRSYTELFSSS